MHSRRSVNYYLIIIFTHASRPDTLAGWSLPALFPPTFQDITGKQLFQTLYFLAAKTTPVSPRPVPDVSVFTSNASPQSRRE